MAESHAVSLGCDCIHCLLQHVGEDDTRTLLRQSPGNSATDSGGGSGDPCPVASSCPVTMPSPGIALR